MYRREESTCSGMCENQSADRSKNMLTDRGGGHNSTLRNNQKRSILLTITGKTRHIVQTRSFTKTYQYSSHHISLRPILVLPFHLHLDLSTDLFPMDLNQYVMCISPFPVCISHARSLLISPNHSSHR